MAHDQPHGDERSESHERFLLPLVVPAAILLFAILVIYGLSRIYLELNDWHYKDVGMATPLAIGIAIVILAVSAILASRPVSGVVIGLIAVVAAAGLTGGAIWAAVHPDTALEVVVVPTATTGQPGTPTAPGQIQVTLDDDPAFAIVAAPDSTGPGSVTFSVENAGTATHNFNIVKTELAADKLPVNGIRVDETQLEILATIADFSAGETQTATADLQPGAYVIFCNVPAHYGQGMHAAFTVGPSGGGGAPPP